MILTLLSASYTAANYRFDLRKKRKTKGTNADIRCKSLKTVLQPSFLAVSHKNVY